MIRKILSGIANYFFATKRRREIRGVIDISNKLNWPDSYKKNFEKYAKVNKRTLAYMACLPFVVEGFAAYTTFIEHKPEEVGWGAFAIGMLAAQGMRIWRRRFDREEAGYTVDHLASKMEDCVRYNRISLDEIVAGRS